MPFMRRSSGIRRHNASLRAGRVARRGRLAVEPLERRGMLAAVLGEPLPVCDMPVAVDVPPLPEGWSLALVDPWGYAWCWLPPPDAWEPPPPHELPGEGELSGGKGLVEGRDGWLVDPPTTTPNLAEEYREFVALHPAWPEEHGAGGIQLMVITPSRHVPWVELGTPGEARAFDAWYEATYLRSELDDPLPPTDDVPVFAQTGVDTATSPTPTGPAALPLSDAIWAGLGSPHAGAESTATAPAGNRRRR